MIKVMLKTILFSFFLLTFPAQAKMTVELKADASGLFSNLLRVVEWIYAVKNNPEMNLHLYMNMRGVSGYSGNGYDVLFKPFEDPDILLETQEYPRIEFSLFPCYFTFYNLSSDHLENSYTFKYVYQTPTLYCDSNFSTMRYHIHSIIEKYLQPLPHIQKKIDDLVNQMKKHKVGIQVRAICHYVDCHLSPQEFLDAIVKDVDDIMKNRDLDNTTLYVATLLEPLLARLSEKYHVVASDTRRQIDIFDDWVKYADSNDPHLLIDPIVDVWTLAECDEIWGSVSNILAFASHLAPNTPVRLLPSLAQFRGY